MVIEVGRLWICLVHLNVTNMSLQEQWQDNNFIRRRSATDMSDTMKTIEGQYQ